MPALQLPIPEAEELWLNFCRVNRMDPEQWKWLRDFAFERSERHPGLLTRILDTAAEANPPNFLGNPHALAEQFKSLLTGPGFLNMLHNTRGFVE